MSFAVPLVLHQPYVVFCGTATILTSDATYTHASVDFSNPSSDRVIVVVFAHRDSGATGDAVASSTIGGVTAVRHTGSVSGVVGVAIHSAVVPTGTTGSIVWTPGDTVDHSWIAVYAVYGLRSMTPTDTDTQKATPTITFSGLTCQPGGIIIAGAAGGSTLAYTTSGLTENADARVEDGTYCAASTQWINTGAAATAISLTAGNPCTGCAVSFR